MKIAWNQDGLIPVVVQDYRTHEVLMLAWMNEQALQTTIKSGLATYFPDQGKSCGKKVNNRAICSWLKKCAWIAMAIRCYF